MSCCEKDHAADFDCWVRCSCCHGLMRPIVLGYRPGLRHVSMPVDKPAQTCPGCKAYQADCAEMVL
jgi:hypothetical protein